MTGLSMLGGDIVAFLVSVRPGILSLFAAGLLVLAVLKRTPIRTETTAPKVPDNRRE